MAKKYLDNNGLTYFWGKVKNKLDDKQDTLTAGDNITINNNVISASGGGSVDIATNSEVDAIFEEYDTTSVFLVANTTAWEQNPYCYVWIESQQRAYKTWPGVKMTKTKLTYPSAAGGDDYPIYRYTFPTGLYDRCIFSQNGSNQTEDLIVNAGKVYDLSSGEWVDMRTKPLEEDKIISVKGLNEYNIKMKEYVDSVVLDTLGGSY